jgi:hypothetical protein
MGATTRVKTGKRLAIAGLVLQLGPIIGFAATIIGMVRAFNKLASGGLGRPEALAEDIGLAIIGTAIGLSVGIVGLVLIFVALIKFKYRERWFYWVMMGMSMWWLVGFPVGTVLGILTVVYLVSNRREFRWTMEV